MIVVKLICILFYKAIFLGGIVVIFDYDEYEKECRKIQKENEEYLKLFEIDLKNSGLKESTINRHIRNVDFYINEFLLMEEPQNISEGVFCLEEFLGEFFIRKCMWSTPSSIKTYASSIKKFYKSMMDHEIIDKALYEFLCSDIKDNLVLWQSTCEIYNDPSAQNPFYPF